MNDADRKKFGVLESVHIMTTLWMCPCTRPHMVTLPRDPGKERIKRYCRSSRMKLDILFLCRRNTATHIYVTRRRRAVP